MCYIKRVPPVSPFALALALALAFALALAPSSPLLAAPHRAVLHHVAPHHVLSPASSPLCIQPIANLRCDATHVQRVPKVPALPVYLPACLRELPCLHRLLASFAYLLHRLAFACLRRSRFALENRSLLEYIGEYEERPRRVAGSAKH